MVKPSRRREMAQKAVSQKQVSIRLACWMFSISETCYRYRAKLSSENAEIADWLIRLTHNQRNWGFGLCFLHLRNVKGFGWNHKRVYRIYRELELNLRIMTLIVKALASKWTSRFRQSGLSDRWIRSLSGEVNRVLSVVTTGLNTSISGKLSAWAEQRDIKLAFIQPGKPQQNAYIERYNRTVRYDWLAQYLFESTEEVQDYATRWLWHYNHERPNMGLGGITPQQKLAMMA